MNPEPSIARPAGSASLVGIVITLVAAGAWAALAPPERSLGEGIRVVYLHVSATLAGLVCLYGVGILGAVTAARPIPAVEARLRPMWTAGLAAYVVGFALSLLSAWISWGGIFWAEPRVRASLGVVAVGLVALAWGGGEGMSRARNLVWTAAAAVAFVVLRLAPLYIHPDRPVQSTTPLGIRAAFLGIFVLFLAATLLLGELLARGRR